MFFLHQVMLKQLWGFFQENNYNNKDQDIEQGLDMMSMLPNSKLLSVKEIVGMKQVMCMLRDRIEWDLATIDGMLEQL